MVRTFREYMEDKMASIDPQQALQGKPQAWIQAVSRLPIILQQETLDERPQPTQEDIEYVNSWKVGKQPVQCRTADLLKNPNNLSTIARCSAPVVDKINKQWELQVKPGIVYDRTPNRHWKNAKRFTGNTAKPSVMVNGEIIWGCGRFISALLRGDQQMGVWDIKSDIFI